MALTNAHSDFSLPLDQRSLRNLVGNQADLGRGQPQQIAPILPSQAALVPSGKSRWTTSAQPPEVAPPQATLATPAAARASETRRLDQTPADSSDWLYRVRPVAGREPEPDSGVQFIDNPRSISSEIVEAELIEQPALGDSGILFIN